MTANWGIHLFHATWQAAVVALLAIAVTRTFPSLSSRFRYALVALAMIKFALPPMVAVPSGAFGALPAVGSPFLWPLERPFVVPSTILRSLMLVHACGAAVTLAWLVSRALRMRLLLRDARPIDRGVVVSADAPIPFVYGLVRPVIVIPASLGDSDALGDVLAHERMHAAQGDSRHAALQAALAVIWWWNPIYWFLSAELSRVREERCDDAVLAAGLATPWRYSRSIIDVAAGVATSGGVPMAAHPLERRLRRLGDHRLSRSTRLTRSQLAVLVLAALILLPGVARHAGPHHAVHIHAH